MLPHDLPPRTVPPRLTLVWVGRKDSLRKTRFPEDHIAAALKEHEAGTRTAELCQRLRIRLETPYRWERKYGGLEGPRPAAAGGRGCPDNSGCVAYPGVTSDTAGRRSLPGPGTVVTHPPPHT